MTSFDFAPLFRSTVGFDKLLEMLDTSVRPDWPPYDIEKTSESAYRITMAIAGFGPEDLEVTQHGAQLLVTGRKQSPQGKSNLLHQGIGQRNFQQRFSLADHVKVAGATVENGLLTIDLIREVPEQLRPRKIQIGTQHAPAAVQNNSPKPVDAIEGQRTAA